jgi:hypothetical protein
LANICFRLGIKASRMRRTVVGITTPECIIILLEELSFLLTANGFLPGGSGTTIRHDTQTTHITQCTVLLDYIYYTTTASPSAVVQKSSRDHDTIKPYLRVYNRSIYT